MRHKSPDILPCAGGGEAPVQYTISYEGRDHHVHYRNGTLSVWVLADDGERELFAADIGAPGDSSWSDEHTTVYLALVSEALRGGSLNRLVAPPIAEAQLHPYFVKGPHPHHRVGLTCGKRQAPVPVGETMNRHARQRRGQAGLHDHEGGCFAWVPAADVEAWIAAHPDEHRALLEAGPPRP